MQTRGVSLALLVVICVLAPRSSEARLRRVASSSPPTVLSPDGRHRAVLTSTGRLELDGLPVSGARRVIGQPVWRRDSRAVAVLQRSAAGVQLLVVLLDVDPLQPLIWTLPAALEHSLKRVFWISSQRVGVGEKALVPRLVVSWTSTLV